MKPTYSLKAKVWKYQGKAAWHFLTIDIKTSRILKDLFGMKGQGFGSIPVHVTIGETTWKTSIFPDSKTQTYILPVKKDVREAEGISDGSQVTFTIEILV